MCVYAGMTALQLEILGVGERLSGTRGQVVPVGVSMLLPPRVLNLPHISGGPPIPPYGVWSLTNLCLRCELSLPIGPASDVRAPELS